MKHILFAAVMTCAGGCASGTADVAAALEKVKHLDALDERNDDTVVLAYDREIRRLSNRVLDYETIEELQKLAGQFQGQIPVEALHPAFKALESQRDRIMAAWDAKLDEFRTRPERERKRKLIDAASTYIGALDDINQQVQALVGKEETP